MKRRDFLKLGVAGAAAAAGLKGMMKAASAKPTFPPVPVCRALGETGLRITIVSFGAMLTPEYEVMEAAFNMGVNYVDTARRYMNGRNEEIVGKAIKGRRDKVFVATKTQPGSVTRMEIVRDVEKSLEKLRTDYIDVIQLHSLDSRNKHRMFNQETRGALLELRKQGKVRFFGVTTHTNVVDVLNTLADDKDRFFDTALVAYNFTSPPEIKNAVARAAQAGIGIVAMKTQAGGYKTGAIGALSIHQAALKWALEDRNVTAAIPGMKDMSMVEEDLAVMGMKMTASDMRILKRYSMATESCYCRLCAKCEPTCPKNVSISVANRSLMYGEGYGEWELARSTYSEIAPLFSPGLCLDCGQCVARCVHGLNISSRMKKARMCFS